MFAVIAGIVMIKQIEAGVKSTALEKAVSDLYLGYEYIDTLYPGDWQVVDNELYKGNIRMNENFQLVDRIGELTGDTVTIFLGDTRVATNVTIDGKRAVGTQVSSQVAEAVLSRGEVFLGEANVVGTVYQAAYMPIKNAAGDLIGIWYVGAPQEFIDSTITSAKTALFISLLGIIFIAIVVIVFFVLDINKRLRSLTDVFAEAGNGNFTIQLTDVSNDEIGILNKSYNQMRNNLSDLIKHIIRLSDNLVHSSTSLAAGCEQTIKGTEHINAAIEEAAAGSEQQAISVEKSNTATTDITCDIQAVTSNIIDVAAISQKTSEQADDGNHSIQKTMSQMNQVRDYVNDTVTNIQSLEERSKDIEKIVSVITGIAEQTNLLALNASIEAARAGEHGKGFAVVAEEVRKLAEQSEISARQITELIGQVQADTNTSVKAMNTVQTEVLAGRQMVENAQAIFANIAQSTKGVSSQIQEITATSEMLANNIEHISGAIKDISDIAQASSSQFEEVAASTEEQSAAIEQITASASSLQSMADELKNSIAKFKV
ncbi:hypothetical protein BHF68_06430 [Desulfuribacillus alkaliarsenatis]|uniref:Chemotaxis protein n=2 Tax=Desulfuribacillus alkaliarsenatis TaxID=766136 RepID=A0A1E5G1T2_9FIRM|nr:hypothetical protein BHF68_06430 [Desulfuribacillus alkaliarsenatis]